MPVTHNSFGQAMEFAVHEIVSCRYPAQPFHFRWAWKSSDTSLLHENGDKSFADDDAHRLGQLGVNSARSVGSAAGDVDFVDESGEPLTAYPRLRCWPVAVLVVTGAHSLQEPGNRLLRHNRVATSSTITG